MKTYYRWKRGEKVAKAPWVITYYESITDTNQYEKAEKVADIYGLFMFVTGIICGMFCALAILL